MADPRKTLTLSAELKSILTNYQDTCAGDPVRLLDQIPEEEMWRFFIDLQRQSPGERIRDSLVKKGIEEKSFDLSVENFLKEYKDTFPDEIEMLKTKTRYNESLHSSLRCFLQEQNGWLSFEKKEPGYLVAMMQTWRRLSEKLLEHKETKDSPARLAQLAKTFHCQATKNVTGVGMTWHEFFNPNEKRTEDAFLKEPGTGYPLQQSNTTRKGFEELFKKIMDTPFKENAGHFFCLELVSPELPEPTSTVYVLAHEQDTEKSYAYGKKRPPVMIAKTLTEEQKEKFFTHHFMKNYFTGVFAIPRGEDSDKEFTAAINDLGEVYVNALLAAEPGSLEALTAILKYTIDCEQLHPFADANTRSYTMSLMNYLLMANGFPPVILEDPNRMEGYAVDEMVQEVLRGMKATLALACDKTLVGELSTENIKKMADPRHRNILEQCIAIEKERRAFVAERTKSLPLGPAAPR